MNDEDRPLWGLSRDEKRVLLIAFAGGLASILAGAAIVGAGLALARYENRFSGNIHWLVFTTVCLVILASLLARWRKGLGPAWVVLSVATLVVCGSVTILAWLGLAAGVK